MRGFTKMMMMAVAAAALAACVSGEGAGNAASVGETAHYDVLIRDGMVYDGAGGAGVVADVAIDGDRIAAVGDLDEARADKIVDASGMAVAPGFINMLSWAVDDLIEDGRSLGDIRQGVTLEVFGEGWSMGPMTNKMKADALAAQ
ncbi:MAG: hypothetical protein R3C40_11770 [Parvularculaceae bacterium]